MPPITPDTFNVYADSLQAAALNTTCIAATCLPADLAFHRSIDSSLARDVDALATRVFKLTTRLVQLTRRADVTRLSHLEDEEEILDEFARSIVDPMDGMLEGTDSALDEVLGRKKTPSITVVTTPSLRLTNQKCQAPRGRLDPTLTHASHLPKPQLKFTYVPSNADESPYIPATLIPRKWHAKVALGCTFQDESSMGGGIYDEEVSEEEQRQRISHPYYPELSHMTHPEHIFHPPLDPVQPPSLENNSSHLPTFVSNLDALLSFAKKISLTTELAVDLEHHSYRSYRGFLALMQVSTRQEDFIIDLLEPDIREALRQDKGKVFDDSEDGRMSREAGEAVARVFADPSVVKVFHGAESDIVWLQQDFNIFVVGLFDTFHASKVLEFPKHSLANLSETYCNFVPDKRYQLADWRIRPLPAEMLVYAQSDTHFLLYIYDRLRLALLDKATLRPSFPDSGSGASTSIVSDAMIRTVLVRSGRTALRLYEVEVYDVQDGSGPGGWDTLARRWNKSDLTAAAELQRPAQEAAINLSKIVYQTVHRWREDIARKEDESTRYVLPTHYLFLIAERFPTTVSDLLSLFGGGSGVPPILKRRARELIDAIQTAVQAARQYLLANVVPDETAMVAQDSSASMLPDKHNEEGGTVTTPKSTGECQLWSLTPSPRAVSARSTLFGDALFPPLDSFSLTAHEPYAAMRSSMLGDSSKVKYVFMFHAASKQFLDVVEKIHRTLVIMPLTPLPAVVIEADMQVEAATNTNAIAGPSGVSITSTGSAPCELAGQIEIPFVPAQQRQHRLSAPTEDDLIVVVGQTGARQRKRKREKHRASAPQSTTCPQSEAVVGDQNAELYSFDYSSVPNPLDGKGDHRPGRERRVEDDDRKKKRQRQNQESGIPGMGKFQSPRDQREIKSGNKTHTFR